MAESPRLTHHDEQGRPRMVDVGEKPATERIATAEGRLVMTADTLRMLQEGTTPKGDPLVVARIAGIQAAKRTAELVPLCHPLSLDAIDVEIEPDPALPGLHARATVRVTARTGVEMEALTAVTVALLAAYDMLKAADRGMRIEGVRLLRKSGGRSGEWDIDATPGPPHGSVPPRAGT
jgi:cyclic pyranopterin monophosphate synthase